MHIVDAIKMTNARIHYLEMNHAKMGISTPPHILMELDAQQQIRTTLRQLYSTYLETGIEGDVSVIFRFAVSNALDLGFTSLEYETEDYE